MDILLVEDDAALSQALCQALRAGHYAVNAVARGAAALHVAETEKPDIMILDLGLPDQDGLQVLRTIRAKKIALPVLILTARGGLDDRIKGLDLGADDYLAKPFEMSELAARLRVIERRLSHSNSPELVVGGVSLNRQSHQVCANDKTIELSRREYMLLKSLMENAGRVQTRDLLERRLYSWGEEVSSNALEVHIHHLRRKLGNDFIQTIRGVGYRVGH